MEVEHAQGSSTTHLYLANTEVVGHGSKVKEGMVWWWGEKENLFWSSYSSSFGEMLCWDDIPPKRGKYEIESLGACHRG